MDAAVIAQARQCVDTAHGGDTPGRSHAAGNRQMLFTFEADSGAYL